MISVAVADDQPLVRAGIVMLLHAQPDLEVVGEAADGAEAVALAARLRPEVMIIDVRMPGLDGVEATRRITEETAATPDQLVKVLILTTFNDDEAVYAALRAGASGFLLKHAAPQDLISAVHSVAGGGSWLDPAVAGTVIKALADVPRAGADLPMAVQRLTPREREVLGQMALGLSNAEISRHFVLSEATVKTHVARILIKTGSRDRAAAVALAYRSGLVVPPTR